MFPENKLFYSIITGIDLFSFVQTTITEIKNYY